MSKYGCIHSLGICDVKRNQAQMNVKWNLSYFSAASLESNDNMLLLD